ncbi:FAD-binding oxidoreductase [Vreelandella stevensii]|uniref:FAD-binding oxidoreductase n=1 Tax=Vreelandella stevensii TaxID=502821 RepID=UPI0002EEB31E|nr:FAD-binding oxidoreductase [Halomonas stevensii]
MLNRIPIDVITLALQSWRIALGPEAVIDDRAELQRYTKDTSEFSSLPLAVLLPVTTAEVQELVRIAAMYNVPLHPISTGRNWGYGSANAPVDGCVIVDLSRMCRIRSFDSELGLATIEPGVTQAELRSWLDERDFPFMVPTTGAGPGCSIVGNALERGYGITPIADHFAAVVSVEAILPDGTVYRSSMLEEGAASGFKWGIGPYVDGLFSQGNIGIVTEMTVVLARRPECIEAFYFWIDSDQQLESAVEAVRKILQTSGANVGGINLMSAARVMAMSQSYPVEHVIPGQPLSDQLLEALARRAGAAAWMGIGSVYGSRRHASATRWLVRKALAGTASRVIFMTSAKAGWMAALFGRLPWTKTQRMARTLDVMRQGISLLEGVPSEVALPLAYWKGGKAPETELHPARDGCGLLWYAPIVPIRSMTVRHFVELVRTTCAEYGFEAPITLTSISERSFDCTLPILFDRGDEDACRRADECWHALFKAGRKEGFVPYRLHTRYATSISDPEKSCWRVVAQIKGALDPQGLISPGRWQSISARADKAALEPVNEGRDG